LYDDERRSGSKKEIPSLSGTSWSNSFSHKMHLATHQTQSS